MRDIMLHGELKHSLWALLSPEDLWCCVASAGEAAHALDTWAKEAAEQVAQESLAEALKPKNDPYYRKESRKGKRW